MDGTVDIAPRRPTVAELIARSDFARLNPQRAVELLERCSNDARRLEHPRRGD